MIKVLLVEDIEITRENYKKLINTFTGIECVTALPNAMNIVQDIQTIMPDVVLMDINLPMKNGITAVREIRNIGIEVPIVMHTVFEDDKKVFESICAGANGYVLKSTPENQLQNIIQEAVYGGAPLTPSIAIKVLKFLREKNIEMYANKSIPSEDKLNKRQYEVLELLMDGASYKMIATDLNISIETVRYHIKKIYIALHIHSRGELTRVSYKNI